MDEFLCAKSEISLETQENILVCLNLRVPSCRPTANLVNSAARVRRLFAKFLQLNRFLCVKKLLKYHYTRFVK